MMSSSKTSHLWPQKIWSQTSNYLNLASQNSLLCVMLIIKSLLLTAWFTLSVIMRATQGQLVQSYSSVSVLPWLMFCQFSAGMWRVVDKAPEQKDREYYRAAQQDARVERRNRVTRAQLQRQSHSGLNQELPDSPQQRLWVPSSACLLVYLSVCLHIYSSIYSNSHFFQWTTLWCSLAE